MAIIALVIAAVMISNVVHVNAPNRRPESSKYVIINKFEKALKGFLPLRLQKASFFKDRKHLKSLSTVPEGDFQQLFSMAITK